MIKIHIDNLTIHQAARPVAGVLKAFAVEALAAGVAVESAANERFVLIHENQIVVDNETGLWWPVKESDETLDHDDGTKYCADFRLGGFSDWFMPDRKQLESILVFELYAPMLPPQMESFNEYVWTSTQTPWTKDKTGSSRSFFVVGTGDGDVSGDYADYRFRVRPARLGGPVPAGQ